MIVVTLDGDGRHDYSDPCCTAPSREMGQALVARTVPGKKPGPPERLEGIEPAFSSGLPQADESDARSIKADQ